MTIDIRTVFTGQHEAVPRPVTRPTRERLCRVARIKCHHQTLAIPSSLPIEKAIVCRRLSLGLMINDCDLLHIADRDRVKWLLKLRISFFVSPRFNHLCVSL